jgi:hypothetical protein
MRARTTILAAVVAVLIGCGGSGGDDGDDVPEPDAPVAAVCTGQPYDSCADTTNWTDCLNGMECRFFMQQGITICTPACDATTPCPPDEDGTPVTCNMMGRCRGEAANSCTLPP